MIQSELKIYISLLAVAVLLMHVVLQSAGWWSVQIITAADGSNCCGAEFCCCDEAGAEICACSITDMPQEKDKDEILFCGIRSNDRENENNSAEVIMEWMDIKALFQAPKTIHQREFTRSLITLPDLYQEVISDLSSPPPRG